MTIKQKKALSNIEKHGSYKDAMLAAGYAPNTAHNPKLNLTEKKGVKELLEQHLPIEESFVVTKKNLYATKRDQFSGEIYDDGAIQLKATDQVYKLHGLYNDDSAQIQGDLNITYVFSEPHNTQSPGDNDQPEQVQDAQLAQESPQNDVRDGQTNL